MADSFIIFTPNPPSISTLTSSGKNSQWLFIKKNLDKLIEAYKKNDFYNQELKLCDIIDQPFSEMTRSHFLKIVKKLADKIKDDIEDLELKQDPVTFNSSDNTIFTLTYKNIFSLVNIIIYIIDNTTSKGKLYDIVYDFVYKGIIPKYKDISIAKQQISTLLSELESIKIIKINLYKENEDIYLNNNDNKRSSSKNLNDINFRMDIKIVLFFSLFIKPIFKSLIGANINLNIQPIDKYFTTNINPYLINEEKILNLGNDYKDIFLCNLILIKSLSKFSYLSKLDLKIYDSYQIELHNILTNIFDISNIDEYDYNSKKRSRTVNNQNKLDHFLNNKNNANEKFFYSPKFNNNYLFIQHLLSAQQLNIYDFCLHFNSLDPLLFSSINYLLTKYNKLGKLQLILFPHDKINKRKTYLNNIIFNKYLNNDDQYSNLYSTDDKKIYYQYIDQKENNNIMNNYILKDEKLLNELFYSFNMNLRALSVILEKQINELLELKIDFSTYNNKSISLYNYDNYNCSIVCFIFDLFKTLQAEIDKCKINSLEIFYEDFLDEKSFIVETIKRKIPSCKNGFQLNNLKLNFINFNISNISLFLPFENFPSCSLTELVINNLTYNDLDNLVNTFKKNKNNFPVLIKLDISLAIMVEDYTKLLEILLKECISQELIYFNMTLPFNISITQLIDILYWIKCNHNIDTNIYLKIINSQLSQCIHHHYFKNCVIDLFNNNRDYLRKKNLLPDFDIQNQQIIKFIINKYDIKNIDYFYSFIFCFNKINSISHKGTNKNIFESIFNYRGKFKKYEVEVEVIN